MCKALGLQMKSRDTRLDRVCYKPKKCDLRNAYAQTQSAQVALMTDIWF